MLRDPYIKTLFIILVRPTLEYGFIVWNPSYQIHSESVQKQFLLFALGHFRWDSRVSLPPYTSYSKLINLLTLSNCREMLGLLLLMEILNGTVCKYFLLSEIKFNLLRFSRQFRPLLLKSCRSNDYNSLAFSDSANSARMRIAPLASVGREEGNRWVIIIISRTTKTNCCFCRAVLSC